MSMCVAAGMAEIASSYPISGGPYYWYTLVVPWCTPLKW